MANDSAAATTGAPDARRWQVVMLLTLGMALAYLDRVNLSVAAGRMGVSLGLSPAQQGVALSAFFLPYALLQIPAGWLVDRYGVRRVYAPAIVLWSVASMATAAATSFAALVALRMLLGVGESVVIPASMRYIRQHFDEVQRGTAVGMLMTGSKLGPAIAFPVAASLLAWLGWPAMFVVTGIIPLFWVLPFLAWVPLDTSAMPPASVVLPGQGRASLRALLGSPMMWGTILGTFSYMYFFYFCLTWMPTYFNQRYGLSLEATGWFTGLSFAGMAAMAVCGGYAADRLIRRGADPVRVRKAFTVGGLVLATTQTLSLATGSTPLMMGFTAFGLCALGLTSANYWALTHTLVPGDSMGTTVGIQNTAASLAGVLAPWLTGWTISATGSFDAPIAFIGLWLALGIVSYLYLVTPRFAPGAAPARPRAA